LSSLRRGAFLPGKLGDFGVALLALWLVAQINPGIALFAVTFDPERAADLTAPPAPDAALVLIEAAESAFQLLGVGLFVALLLRERRYIGGAVLLLVGAALVAKSAAAHADAEARRVGDVAQARGIDRHDGRGSSCCWSSYSCPSGADRKLRDRTACVAVASRARSGPAVAARAAHALQLALRASSQLQRLTQSVLLAWPILAAAWLFRAGRRPAGATGSCRASQTTTP
jgi:hypothetical protein